MRPDDLPTEEIIKVFIIPEKYLKTLKWSKDSEDYIKDLVAGNIRAFFVWLFEHDFISSLGSYVEGD